MKTIISLIAPNRRDGFRRPSAGLGTLPRMWVCILALFMLSVGRPCVGLPCVFAAADESDPVEQEESDLDETAAIHGRRVWHRRMPEQGWLSSARLVSWIAAGESSGRVADLADAVAPHDFDLRNGLGAALRC